jgi:hypothetical protein
LPADGGVRIEEPFDVRRPGSVVVRTHETFITRGD